ncbi:MAG: peptidase [Pseudomonadota bacterium]|jgi:putative proteasome-type protease
MTYCLGMKLDAGMVFASDSRTNAGVDNVGRFEKMRVYEKPGERVIVALSAGNLSVTQNALGLMDHQARKDPHATHFNNASSLFEIAGALGDAMREVQRRDGEYMRANKIDASASFIVGGQIAGEAPRLFLVYTEGNFIESSRETNYFQIGEIKYGKPIIDRVLTRRTSLQDAVKCALISFDSTMRSNISVGPPIDVLVLETDALRVGVTQRLDEGDPYLTQVRQAWSDGLKRLYVQMPAPPWYSETPALQQAAQQAQQ